MNLTTWWLLLMWMESDTLPLSLVFLDFLIQHLYKIWWISRQMTTKLLVLSCQTTSWSRVSRSRGGWCAWPMNCWWATKGESRGRDQLESLCLCLCGGCLRRAEAIRIKHFTLLFIGTQLTRECETLPRRNCLKHINKCNTSYWLSSVSSSLSLSSSSNVCQYSSLSLSAPALRVLDCIRIINCMLFQNMCCLLCWVTAQCYKPLLIRSNLCWPPAPHCASEQS